jgi:3D (Asp-Asp-Asp) domain-containing protein
MANGLIVHSGATACPANLHLGTKIGILGDGFINNSFTCEDRMALKYRHGNYIDIWFSDCDIAIEFGRQKRFVKINN